EGAEVAYRAVIKPTEGTMLTVAREAAAGAEAKAAGTSDLTEVVRAACEAAAEAVERTANQLPILKQAGVIDAGGYGLQLILEGFLKRMRGEAVATFERPSTQHARPKIVEAPSAGWPACTQIVMDGVRRPGPGKAWRGFGRGRWPDRESLDRVPLGGGGVGVVE